MCHGEVLDEDVASDGVQAMWDKLVMSGQCCRFRVLTQQRDVLVEHHQVACVTRLCIAMEH